MQLPRITGIMARRLLVNFRVQPDIAAAFLPKGIEPKLVGGYAIAGLCLVRLTHLRPAGLPAFAGLASENVAFRMAVEWQHAGRSHNAVLILRRETGSHLNHLIGGRLFPGPQNLARIDAVDTPRHIAISTRGMDAPTANDFVGQPATRLPRQSVFRSLDEVAAFFRGSECGYSPAFRAGWWDGLQLSLTRWDLTPIDVLHVRSTFIDQFNRLRPGSAILDCAVNMTNIPHTWTAIPPLPLGVAPSTHQIPAAAQAA